MILADKIIEERKKLGLSQEELAEKLSVSRQAVSKWESAQSIPDLQRIIAMSELFSVSTDYLLKDEMESESRTASSETDSEALRCVSIEEANQFMAAMKEQSRTVSFGVALCILSPVLLIVLNGMTESTRFPINARIANLLGLTALFLMIAAAVFLFIRNSSLTEQYEYLEKEPFETAYGVSGLAKEKKEAYRPIYTQYLSLGIILCVLSPLPLIVSAFVDEHSILPILMTGVLLCMVATGVYMIVRVSTVKSCYDILLQEGEYRKEEKKRNGTVSIVSGIYWSVVTAAYLAWSFITGNWHFTWIIWPVAGVLCAPVMLIARHCSKDGAAA